MYILWKLAGEKIILEAKRLLKVSKYNNEKTN